MMTLYLLNGLLMFLFLTAFGYLLTLVKEKYYLRHNIIFIDSKGITQKDIDKIESKYFRLNNVDIMAGDEMKIYFHNNSMVKGIILGAIPQNNCIYVITPRDKIKSIDIGEIKRFKIVSKYGKMFKEF